MALVWLRPHRSDCRRSENSPDDTTPSGTSVSEGLLVRGRLVEDLAEAAEALPAESSGRGSFLMSDQYGGILYPRPQKDQPVGTARTEREHWFEMHFEEGLSFIEIGRLCGRTPAEVTTGVRKVERALEAVKTLEGQR